MEHFTAREQGDGGVGAGPRATTLRSPRFSSPRTRGTLPAPRDPGTGSAQEERRANPEMPGWPGQGRSPPPQGQQPRLINYGPRKSNTSASTGSGHFAPNPFPGRLQVRLQGTDQAGGRGGPAGRPGHQREVFRVNTLIPSQKGHRTVLHLPRDRR